MTRIWLLFLGLPLAGCLQGVLTNAGSGTGAPGCMASSGSSCQISADCCDADASCCLYSDHSSCEKWLPSVPQNCLCSTSSECDLLEGLPKALECAPLVLTTPGPIVGPYICFPNNGSYFGGCRDVSCTSQNQYCSTDKLGNEFCSTACTSDFSCGNPGVACCNTACRDGGTCCGLCPDAG